MAVKRIHFDYFVCTVTPSNPDAPKIDAAEVLRRLKKAADEKHPGCVRAWRGKTLEARRIYDTGFGYRGVIGRYRSTGLPNIGRPGGDEREIEMAEDELLIEKIHFAFYRDYSLFIIQRNVHAANAETISQYLTADGYGVSLAPLLRAEDIQRLMRGEVMIRAMKLAVARPTNPELFEGMEHDFNNSIMASLKGSNCAMLNLAMRGDGRSKEADQRYLDSRLKRAVLELISKVKVTKAELEIEEGTFTHPVDLVAERVSSFVDVEMRGRYPDQEAMWSALDQARSDKEEEIRQNFRARDGRQLW